MSARVVTNVRCNPRIFAEEEFFRGLCQTDLKEGTAASHLAMAARQLGFEASTEINLKPESG